MNPNFQTESMYLGHCTQSDPSGIMDYPLADQTIPLVSPLAGFEVEIVSFSGR